MDDEARREREKALKEGQNEPQTTPESRQKAFADSPDRRRVIRQAEADLEQGREDTECRGKAPASKRCP